MYRIVIAALVFLTLVATPQLSTAGQGTPSYQVLPPLQQGNQTIYPVIAASAHDTTQFLTLDEGLRSGEVEITEAGRFAQPMIRRPGPRPAPITPGSAEVNRLVLLNRSTRPLLLLAGEIVTGGKQDRVVGTDRIVPPQSDPVDLAVFCVEPGRWTGSTSSFESFSAQMVQPSIRNQAMAKRDQSQVWAEVRKSNAAIGGSLASGGVTSYAGNMSSLEAKAQVDKVAAPISRSYENLLGQLKDHKAVGVVVAINGQLEWADLFASEALLQKYWNKLVRSYAAESLTNSGPAVQPQHAKGGRAGDPAAPGAAEAQQFLNAVRGEREVSQTETGVYRQTEVQGQGWKVFRLTSLLPGADFDVHVAKMTTAPVAQPLGLIRR
jgi:hypothetical protein